MTSSPEHSPPKHSTKYKYFLALTALGVVYGDIGTSPLYAFKEAFHPNHHIYADAPTILGLLSLIFWSLTVVISLKYLIFILRADNHGEGGILALTSLLVPKSERGRTYLTKSKIFLMLLGLFGTALLFGDGVITPAISILSAVEGLALITPVFDSYVIPVTIGILVALFSIQKKGTGAVGAVFGPLMLIWFLSLATLGVYNICQAPEVIKALNPIYIIQFFEANKWSGFAVLGSVFLVVTGGEALYSDLGHFGRKPIQQAWFFVALPGLVLNYFGQGALLIHTPESFENPFFLMAPPWALTPLVILATIATTLASQALITGVFSITMQAIQNGYIPRIQISHTSRKEYGQIYIKRVNYVLMVGCIGLVLAFRTSSNLASAYGFAVTTTMVITTVLFYVVLREKWYWSRLVAGSLCFIFLFIDLSFWSANILKLVEGGWFPLLVGIAGFTIMTTWANGKRILAVRLKDKILPLEGFLKALEHKDIYRTSGVAVFLNRSLTDAPYSLIHVCEHFKTVHKNLIFLTVITKSIFQIPAHERITIEKMGPHNYRVVLRYGYLEQPNIAEDIKNLDLGDFVLDVHRASFVISKENLVATKDIPGMALWREKLFSLLSRNEISATDYFQIPKDRVIEIGVQIPI